METQDIDYETEVKKVYPDARELDNETEQFYADLTWITDGHGNDISDDCKWSDDAWESAYHRITRSLINYFEPPLCNSK